MVPVRGQSMCPLVRWLHCGACLVGHIVVFMQVWHVWHVGASGVHPDEIVQVEASSLVDAMEQAAKRDAALVYVHGIWQYQLKGLELEVFGWAD